jgi:hypothetical protein
MWHTEYHKCFVHSVSFILYVGCHNNPIMLDVVKPSVIILSVVAPNFLLNNRIGLPSLVDKSFNLVVNVIKLLSFTNFQPYLNQP